MRSLSGPFPQELVENAASTHRQYWRYVSNPHLVVAAIYGRQDCITRRDGIEKTGSADKRSRPLALPVDVAAYGFAVVRA
jgi:hypothetical protein